MKTRIPIILLFLVFIAGCKGGMLYSITDTNIYRGTNGLTMEFIGNAPPEEIFEKTIFPVGINLRNGGASGITDGYITFSVEEDYMLLDKTSIRTTTKGKKDFEDRLDWVRDEDIVWEGEKPQMKFSLQGKSIENAEGEQKIITLKAEAKALEELSEIHESSILATACYDYKTELVTTVCVDTDVYNIKGIVKSCKIEDLSFSSQGAPVAVTNIEVKMMPMDVPNKVRPQFLIYIENKGNGLVIKDDSGVIKNACSEKPLNYTELGIIFVNVSLGGEQKKLNCNITEGSGDKKGVVKLRDNEGIVRCVLEEGIDEKEGTYVSLLRIELNYGYTHTISKNIIIKKLSVY